MRFRTLFLFMAVLLSGLATAQVTKVSYDKTIDLLNCKTVELTLPAEKIDQFHKECPCNSADHTQILDFLRTAGNLGATIALSKEVDGVKTEFKDDWAKEEVIKYLSNDIFSDSKYKRLAAFAQKRDGKPEFETYKLNLRNDFVTSLIENRPENESIDSNTATVLETPEQEPTTSSTKLARADSAAFLGRSAHFITVLAILLSILSLFLYINREKKFAMKKNAADINAAKSTNPKESHSPKLEGNISASELRDANNRIRDLESEINRIKAQLETLTAATKPEMPPADMEAKQSVIRSEVFFLSTPNADGSFNESSVHQTYKEGATIYRFTKTGSHTAQFQIDEKDTSIKLAMQYPDKNIDPVCEALNAFNPKATRIHIVEPGEAALQDHTWVIYTKAKIRYEN